MPNYSQRYFHDLIQFYKATGTPKKGDKESGQCYTRRKSPNCLYMTLCAYQLTEVGMGILGVYAYNFRYVSRGIYHTVYKI